MFWEIYETFFCEKFSCDGRAFTDKKIFCPRFFQVMKSKSVSNHKQKQKCGVTCLQTFAEIEVTLIVYLFLVVPLLTHIVISDILPDPPSISSFECSSPNTAKYQCHIWALFFRASSLRFKLGQTVLHVCQRAEDPAHDDLWPQIWWEECE